MASSGEVDFAVFERAMTQGMGGAALKSGETFSGAMANTKAALGRIGETILTPFLGALTSGANGIIPVFDSINESLKPVMESFGQWLSGIDFAGAFAGIGDVFGQISAVAIPSSCPLWAVSSVRLSRRLLSWLRACLRWACCSSRCYLCCR